MGQDVQTIVVLPLNTPVPAHAHKIGSCRVGNNSTETHCNYIAIVEQIKKETVGKGGNLAVITRLVPPAFIGKCYKVVADIYRVDSMQQYNITPTAPKTFLFDSTKAILNVYRLKDTLALEPPYKIFLNDTTEIGRMHGKTYLSYSLDHEATIKLSAKTDKKTEISLHVLPGHQYYIRCGLKDGEFLREPFLEVVDATVGKTEFKQKSAVAPDAENIRYLYEIH